MSEKINYLKDLTKRDWVRLDAGQKYQVYSDIILPYIKKKGEIIHVNLPIEIPSSKSYQILDFIELYTYFYYKAFRSEENSPLIPESVYAKLRIVAQDPVIKEFRKR